MKRSDARTETTTGRKTSDNTTKGESEHENKIAFVAVGQAGGNIGQLFEDRGFNVLYINTSQEDLDTLEHANINTTFRAAKVAIRTAGRRNSL